MDATRNPAEPIRLTWDEWKAARAAKREALRRLGLDTPRGVRRQTRTNFSVMALRRVSRREVRAAVLGGSLAAVENPF